MCLSRCMTIGYLLRTEVGFFVVEQVHLNSSPQLEVHARMFLNLFRFNGVVLAVVSNVPVVIS